MENVILFDVQETVTEDDIIVIEMTLLSDDDLPPAAREPEITEDTSRRTGWIRR